MVGYKKKWYKITLVNKIKVFNAYALGDSINIFSQNNFLNVNINCVVRFSIIVVSKTLIWDAIFFRTPKLKIDKEKMYV